MMHLGRALMDLGHEEEARQFLDRFQKAHRAQVRGPWTQPAMIESASLPAGERGKRAIERLRKDAATHQDDPELQLRLSSLLLAEGRVEEAEAEFRTLLTRNAENRIWLQAGRFLVSFERYQLAREFLERAAASNPSANLDLATAIFYSEGPAKALGVLERVPAQQQSGDYYLLKGKILDAAGQWGDAETVLKQGLQLSISNPQIAREAALLLVRHDRKDVALEFLEKTAGNNPELLLTRAAVLALMDRRGAAEAALKEIESWWPEWDRPYLVHGLLLEKSQPRVAKQKIQTAIALGSKDPAARCTIARIESGPSSDPMCACAGGVYEILFPRCGRP
jgi:tetratricopeptide (TPR) repeat protein